jgi:hypothetical protein
MYPHFPSYLTGKSGPAAVAVPTAASAAATAAHRIIVDTISLSSRAARADDHSRAYLSR